MPYRSEAVANKFIELGKDKEITLMKLLKLVYFAHGWHLALTDNPLIQENVEAWKFGPVVPSVYHAFKENGAAVIMQPFETVDVEEWKRTKTFQFVVPQVEKSDFLNAFFDQMWAVYGDLTAYQLSELTHQADTPWYKVWHEMGGSERKGTDIPDPMIKEYFKSKLT